MMNQLRKSISSSISMFDFATKSNIIMKTKNPKLHQNPQQQKFRGFIDMLILICLLLLSSSTSSSSLMIDAASIPAAAASQSSSSSTVGQSASAIDSDLVPQGSASVSGASSHGDGGTDDDRLLMFENQSFDKRASRFMPMRGRKSIVNPDYFLEEIGSSGPMMSQAGAGAGVGMLSAGDEIELMDLINNNSGNNNIKRAGRISTFMPMRGRKSENFYYFHPNNNNNAGIGSDDGQQFLMNHFIPAASAVASQRYGYFPASSAGGIPSAAGTAGGSIINLPYQQFRFGNGGGSSSSSYPSEQQKRGRGVAFFGSRGKRSIH